MRIVSYSNMPPLSLSDYFYHKSQSKSVNLFICEQNVCNGGATVNVNSFAHIKADDFGILPVFVKLRFPQFMF